MNFASIRKIKDKIVEGPWGFYIKNQYKNLKTSIKISQSSLINNLSAIIYNMMKTQSYWELEK